MPNIEISARKHSDKAFQVTIRTQLINTQLINIHFVL